MSAWLDPAGRCFNPAPQISAVPLFGGAQCLVVDGALARPEGLVEWACAQRFQLPTYPYPGLVLDAPADLAQRMADFFALHLRPRLGARRTLAADVRLSIITTPPGELEPRQWQCHRDRVAEDPELVLYAAAVLYLFRDPAQGGTSFYRPRQSPAQTDQLLAHSQMLAAHEFAARYGLKAGYMGGSNDYFERVASVPAAWNRAIFYDGGLFHSAAIEEPARLVADPARGRLTLNAFFSCRRSAR